MPAMIPVLKISTKFGSDFMLSDILDNTYYHKPQNGFLLLKLRTLNINIMFNDINIYVIDGIPADGHFQCGFLAYHSSDIIPDAGGTVHAWGNTLLFFLLISEMHTRKL